MTSKMYAYPNQEFVYIFVHYCLLEVLKILSLVGDVFLYNTPTNSNVDCNSPGWIGKDITFVAFLHIFCYVAGCNILDSLSSLRLIVLSHDKAVYIKNLYKYHHLPFVFYRKVGKFILFLQRPWHPRQRFNLMSVSESALEVKLLYLRGRARFR